MQPILPVTLLVKKIKGAARQHHGDGDGVVWCEKTFNATIQLRFYTYFILSFLRHGESYTSHIHVFKVKSSKNKFSQNRVMSKKPQSA